MNLLHLSNIIKELRIKKKLTQKDLAEALRVSEKTISKWETGRGFPDISLFEPLAQVLEISMIELFNGELISNHNKSANMLKTKFYVCPMCHNVIMSIGEGVFNCCGNQLLVQDAEMTDHLTIEMNDGQWYIHQEHPMSKNDYISFYAYVTSDRIQFVKLYPEQHPSARFTPTGHGIIYFYHNKNGLFKKQI